MGFVPKKKVYNLVFDDPEMQGLEVKIRGLNTGQVLDLEVKKDAAQRELANDEGSDEEDNSAIVELLQLMSDQVISWNVMEEDGVTPVPTTMDGIRQQDLGFNMAIINAWQTAVAGVPAPLEDGSTSGEPSQVASIPMETLSLSPESTAVPA